MSLALVTPSYRHDAELFTDLHQSVIRCTDQSVLHYVIVPSTDVKIFTSIVDSRCVVISEEDLYPANYKPLGRLSRLVRLLPNVPPHARVAAINTKDLFRPVRGWMMQQVLKLEICRQLSVDTILLVDSDVELIRHVEEGMLRHGEHAKLYRSPNAVDESLPLHAEWIKVSRSLLGLAPGELPAPDYVSSLSVWEPGVVRAMLARVERATGLNWVDAIIRQQTFSEWMLYGIFAEEVLKYAQAAMTESSLCHSYWGQDPLTLQMATEFGSLIKPDDVAVLIQSKTHTPREIRRAAIKAIEFKVNDEHAPSSLVTAPEELVNPRNKKE